VLLIVKQNGLLLPSAKGGDLLWPKHLFAPEFVPYSNAKPSDHKHASLVLACMLLAVGCKKQESRVATSQTIEVTAVKVEPRDEGKDRGQI